MASVTLYVVGYPLVINGAGNRGWGVAHWKISIAVRLKYTAFKQSR